MRAGMTTGTTVIDIVAGPGYATLDAAEIVGPGARSSQSSDHLISFASPGAKATRKR